MDTRGVTSVVSDHHKPHMRQMLASIVTMGILTLESTGIVHNNVTVIKTQSTINDYHVCWHPDQQAPPSPS